MKKLLLLCLCLGNLTASDQIYIDSDELEIKEDIFYIHIGGNMWNETNTLHTDSHGLYYINANNPKIIEKKWKCPYCFMFWPIGQRCGNANCPSKY